MQDELESMRPLLEEAAIETANTMEQIQKDTVSVVVELFEIISWFMERKFPLFKLRYLIHCINYYYTISEVYEMSKRVHENQHSKYFVNLKLFLNSLIR